MNRRIAIIAGLPGVMAACLFSRSEEPLCLQGSLPKEINIKEIGMQIVLFFNLGEEETFPMESVLYRYARATVVGIRLKDGGVLLIVCEPKANSTLVLNSGRKLMGMN